MPKTLATPDAGEHNHRMSDALSSTQAAVNGYRVPSHGRGKLKPFQPGQSGNPSGFSGKHGEVVRLCRQAGPAVARRLIEIALDLNEDSRVSVVAAQEVLNRGFGRAREMTDKDLGGSGLALESVSEEKLSLVIRALEAARDARCAQGDGAAETGPVSGLPDGPEAA